MRQRHEGLGTEGGKFETLRLYADHALQAIDFGVLQFQAKILTLVLEGGLRHTIVFFGVLVIGLAGLGEYAVEQPAQIAEVGLNGIAALLHIDAHGRLGDGAVIAAIVRMRGTNVSLGKLI